MLSGLSATGEIPVPDSGVAAGLGYAHEAKLPFELGLIRSHYVGRTFIEPQQSIRHFGVRVTRGTSSSSMERPPPTTAVS